MYLRKVQIFGLCNNCAPVTMMTSGRRYPSTDSLIAYTLIWLILMSHVILITAMVRKHDLEILFWQKNDRSFCFVLLRYLSDFGLLKEM